MIENARKYFQHELDLAIENKVMFSNTKITQVWFEPKDSLFYCKLEHGNDCAYWRIDKHTVDEFIHE